MPHVFHASLYFTFYIFVLKIQTADPNRLT